MKTWLVKSDPAEYSFSDLERETITAWTGVRNFQARNYLLSMQRGDRVLVYHSGSERAVVGMAHVVRTAYPDPTADDPQWVCVDLKFECWLPQPILLARIKATPELRTMLLLRQSRLSVMPVSAEEFDRLIALAHADQASTAPSRRRPQAR